MTLEAVHPFRHARSFVSPLSDEFDADHQEIRHEWVLREVEMAINALSYARELLLANPGDTEEIVAALRLGTWGAVVSDVEMMLYPLVADPPAA